MATWQATITVRAIVLMANTGERATATTGNRTAARAVAQTTTAVSMNDTLELALESADGIIDCRLEPLTDSPAPSYSATILYPASAGSYSRSDIFCHNLAFNPAAGCYYFEDTEEIHPKIIRLEAQLSAAILKARKR